MTKSQLKKQIDAIEQSINKLGADCSQQKQAEIRAAVFSHVSWALSQIEQGALLGVLESPGR